VNKWLTVCPTKDLPDGSCKTVDSGMKVIAVFNSGGELHAIDDFCPHMGAALSGGHVEDGMVTCPWHAWRFRLCDGAWADNPKIRIGSYAVRENHGIIEVNLPDSPSP